MVYVIVVYAKSLGERDDNKHSLEKMYPNTEKVSWLVSVLNNPGDLGYYVEVGKDEIDSEFSMMSDENLFFKIKF